jgi:hypothetical protein
MQQHPPRRLYTRMQVNLGVAKRHRDELQHLLYARFDAAEVRETRSGWGVRFGGGGTDFGPLTGFIGTHTAGHAELSFGRRGARGE